MCACVRARSLMAATLPTSWSAAGWGPGGVKHGRVTSVLVHSQVIKFKMIREELASRWFILNGRRCCSLDSDDAVDEPLLVARLHLDRIGNLSGLFFSQALQ